MPDEWTDIQVVDLDMESSRANMLQKNLTEVHLVLSDTPPIDWVQYFQVAWKTRRHAHCAETRFPGNHLVITCAPAELMKVHMPHIRHAIKDTNRVFREAFRQRQVKKSEFENAEVKRQDDLKKIREQLKLS